MLQTQVNYWNLVETQRHNLASEDYYNRSLSETTRHNLASEDYYNRNLGETTRHNLVTEKQNQTSLNEQARHNTTTEYLTYQAQNETARHNQVMEGQGWAVITETNRHNVASENETVRHNIRVENEATRHNTATEAETTRHNLASEGIDYANSQTNRYNAETNRMNAYTNQRNASTNAYNAAIQADYTSGMIDIGMKNASTNVLKQFSYDSSVQSQNKLNKANADLAKKKAQYAGQQNAREWVNTGINALNAVGKVLGGIGKKGFAGAKIQSPKRRVKGNTAAKRFRPNRGVVTKPRKGRKRR